MNKWRKYFLIAATCVIIDAVALVACGEDLRSCYDLALDKDPQLRGAQYKREAAREALTQAWSRFLPAISFDFDFTNTFQDVVESENTVTPTGTVDYFSQSYTAQLTQPILHFDSFAQLSQSKVGQSRSDQELQAARQDMMVRVTESYMGVLAAKDTIRYLRAEESSIQKHYDFADMSYQKGLVPKTDLEDATAKLESIKADEVEAERAHDTAVQALREVIGVAVPTVKELAITMPFQPPDPDDVDAWIAKGMEHNAVLRAKRFESDEAQKEVSRQRAGHYPYADLQTRWNRKDSGGSIYGGGNTIDSVDVMVKVSLPIFSGGVINSKVRESVANYQRLLQETIKTERQMVRQVRDSFHGMKSSMRRVGALQKSVESQRLVLEAKEQGFKSGRYSTIEVLDAARDLNLYQRNLAKAKYEYITNYVKLKQAAGTLEEGEITRINGWLD